MFLVVHKRTIKSYFSWPSWPTQSVLRRNRSSTNRHDIGLAEVWHEVKKKMTTVTTGARFCHQGTPYHKTTFRSSGCTFGLSLRRKASDVPSWSVCVGCAATRCAGYWYGPPLASDGDHVFPLFRKFSPCKLMGLPGFLNPGGASLTSLCPRFGPNEQPRAQVNIQVKEQTTEGPRAERQRSSIRGHANGNHHPQPRWVKAESWCPGWVQKWWKSL